MLRTICKYLDRKDKGSWMLFFASLFFSCLMLPTSASAAWFGEYWNITPGSSPAIPTGAANMTYTSPEINFDWGKSSPAPGTINIDGFVVRWTQTVTLPAGNYYFEARSDDGIRVYVDNEAIINAWIDQGATTNFVTIDLSAGSHTFRVEYYENSEDAVAQFHYENRNPLVQSYFPADNATGAVLGANLVLTFDRNVYASAGSADDIVIYDGGGRIVEQINVANADKVSISGGAVTINPAGNLEELSGYYVRIGSDVFYASSTGAPYFGISDNMTWNFTTGDFTAPDTGDNYGAKDGVWQNTDQTITLAPHDPLPSSGVAWTKYCTDDGTLACDPAAGTTLASPYQITISSEGTTYLRYASQDSSGNTQTTVSREIKIDKTAPIVSAGSDRSSGLRITQTASVSDAVSGIDTATYAWTGVSGPGTVSFGSSAALSTTIDADECGTYVIRFSASDNAGNSASDTFTFIKEGAAILPPQAYAAPSAPDGGFRMYANGGDDTTSDRKVTLELKAGPDATRMALSATPDFNEAEIEDYAPRKSWDLCAGNGFRKDGPVCTDGEYTVYVKFYTKWGRSSQPVSVSIRLISEKGTTPVSLQPAPLLPQILTPTPSFVFTRQLWRGARGEDVRQLQMLLNRIGFIVAYIGPGSAGHETAYYGAATERAVIALQRKHDLRPYPGNVGPATLKLLNSL